jgi:hypothetical protein
VRAPDSGSCAVRVSTERRRAWHRHAYGRRLCVYHPSLSRRVPIPRYLRLTWILFYTPWLRRAPTSSHIPPSSRCSNCLWTPASGPTLRDVAAPLVTASTGTHTRCQRALPRRCRGRPGPRFCARQSVGRARKRARHAFVKACACPGDHTRCDLTPPPRPPLLFSSSAPAERTPELEGCNVQRLGFASFGSATLRDYTSGSLPSSSPFSNLPRGRARAWGARRDVLAVMRLQTRVTCLRSTPVRRDAPAKPLPGAAYTLF